MAAPSTMDAFFPPRCVYVPRVVPGGEAWLATEAWQPDALTGLQFAVLGDMPVIAHAAACTLAARELFEGSGIAWPADVRPYRTSAEAVTLMEQASAAGERLVQQHTAPGDGADFAWLVPPDVRARLNDKCRLAEFVPPETVIDRRLWTLADDSLASTDIDLPIVLKAASLLGSGAGHSVRVCRTHEEFERAVAMFRARAAHLHGIVVERHVEFADTWCVNIAVFDDRTDAIGAARQWTDANGDYLGNLIDPGVHCPSEIVEAVQVVAERARRVGYRGLAGVDAGLDPAGIPRIFDLNFRLNGSTAPLLAVRRFGLAGALVSRPILGQRSPDSLLRALAPAIAAGELVPLGMFDASEHDDPAAVSLAQVVVRGRTLNEAKRRHREIARRAADQA
jgi:hypothetical protein